MFLFTKRARRIVKYAWATFSVLIILSMVITYSGFTLLSRSQPNTDEIPPEVLAQLMEQQNASTTTAEGSFETTPASTPEPVPPVPQAEPVPQLNFSL